MPALRFLALATLAFVLPAGAFLWHQQLARLEREAVRVLRGPDLALEPGARATWRLALDASTEDEAWMDCQRQPRLSLRTPAAPSAPLTASVSGTVSVSGTASAAERPRLRARARYLAAAGLPEVDAFLASEPGGWRGAEPGPDGVVELGALWLSYVQPLEIEVEVLAWPAGADAAPIGAAHPVLSGEVSADYAFARELDRTVFIAFVCLGVLGVALLAFTERRRCAPPGAS